ncbi:hypothetical protein D1AOALGA4SA_6504 [Olavius algarvensis Delta 1 endosymbiont]|nr:hypothetical protein D1AOALGA4SA_6504 [Olavius algarvensis Delta 1 endosymbiont]
MEFIKGLCGQHFFGRQFDISGFVRCKLKSHADHIPANPSMLFLKFIGSIASQIRIWGNLNYVSILKDGEYALVVHRLPSKSFLAFDADIS